MSDVIVRGTEIRKIENGYLLSWYEELKEPTGGNCPMPCSNKQMSFTSVEEAIDKVKELLG